MTSPVPDRPDEHDEPESEFIKCPDCKGKPIRVRGIHFERCKTCHGTGEILNPNLSEHEQACALYNRNRY